MIEGNIVWHYIYDRYGYDPNTGAIYYKQHRSGEVKERKSTTDDRGYKYFNMGLGSRDHRKTVSVHRFAAECVTQEPIPEGLQVDHLNRDPGDNRWINLRIVTPLENHLNRLIELGYVVIKADTLEEILTRLEELEKEGQQC